MNFVNHFFTISSLIPFGLIRMLYDDREDQLALLDVVF